MYKDIHLRLKEARMQEHLKQEDVAKELKVSRTVISRYENGKLEPNLENLCKLIELYGINANWLLGTGKYLDE